MFKACTTKKISSFITPKLAQNKKDTTDFCKLLKEQDDLESKFSKVERSAYEKFYMELRKDSNVSNACRDFVL